MEIKKYEILKSQEDSIQLQKQKIEYTFSFEKGTFEDGTEITAFCYTSKGENRPVVFFTNGGPGSGVAWLHIGFCAPKKIRIENDLEPQMSAPFTLEDNPNTLIDIADLVFIDPPATGYSYMNEEHKKEYSSVDGDACAVARFIERWRIEHRLTNRRTYFMGESYGTVRGPALLDALMGGSLASTGRLVGISLDGIILLGSVVSTTPFDLWKYQPVEESVLNLECCAAAYAYHTKKDVRKAAKLALEFAPDYARALFMGNSIKEIEKRHVAKKLHSLIGLDEKKLLKNHLRYTMNEFLTETIPGKTIGFYDGRYLLDGKGNGQDKPFPNAIDVLAEDSAMGQYSTCFIQGMELLAEKYDLPKKPYPLINCVINKEWNRHGERTTLASLENAQRRNKKMRILFLNGLLDMCTVPGGVHYVVNQSGLDLNRVEIKEYISGHMAYLGEENAKAMSKDVREFILK